MLTRRTAERLGLDAGGSSVAIGSGSARIDASGAVKYAVRLHRRPRAKLRSRCQIDVRLETVATDREGNRSVRSRRLTLRRGC
jgi:hypothetical protein